MCVACLCLHPVLYVALLPVCLWPIIFVSVRVSVAVSAGLCASHPNVCLCLCLSVCPSCLCAQLIYLYHTHPTCMPLTCRCLHVFGRVSILLLSLPCLCPICDGRCWVGLPRCVSDPVGVSLLGSLSVAKVRGVRVSGLGLFWGDCVCVYSLPPPPPSLATLGHVYSAPSRFLPCPGRG